MVPRILPPRPPDPPLPADSSPPPPLSSCRAVVFRALRVLLTRRRVHADCRAIHPVLRGRPSVPAHAGPWRCVRCGVRRGPALPVCHAAVPAPRCHPVRPSAAGSWRGRDRPHQRQHQGGPGVGVDKEGGGGGGVVDSLRAWRAFWLCIRVQLRARAAHFGGWFRVAFTCAALVASCPRVPRGVSSV